MGLFDISRLGGFNVSGSGLCAKLITITSYLTITVTITITIAITITTIIITTTTITITITIIITIIITVTIKVVSYDSPLRARPSKLQRQIFSEPESLQTL